MAVRFSLARRPKAPSRPQLGADDGGWIGGGRRSFFEYSVGSLVPVVFERYARVLHPARGLSDEPVRWDAVAAWSGRTIHALAQWDPLSHPLGEARGSCPFVQPPAAGGLPQKQLATLCGVLAAHTRTPHECFVGVWEGYGRPGTPDATLVSELRLDQRTFLVFRESIGTAARIGWPDRGILPPEPVALIWPADRAWFVAGDVDLEFHLPGWAREPDLGPPRRARA